MLVAVHGMVYARCSKKTVESIQDKYVPMRCHGIHQIHRLRRATGVVTRSHISFWTDT